MTIKDYWRTQDFSDFIELKGMRYMGCSPDLRIAQFQLFVDDRLLKMKIAEELCEKARQLYLTAREILKSIDGNKN